MTSDVVCGPLPIVASLGVFVFPQHTSNPKAHFISQEPKEWPSHSTITYTFLDDREQIYPWRVQLVEDAINEYTRYANVNLTRTPEDKDESADIRISFKSEGGAWSAIGTDALKITKEATMNLGFLSKFEQAGPTTIEARTDLYNYTLHEFGHAFGLVHEWVAPLAPLLGRNETIQQYKNAIKQHTEAYKDEPMMSNFMREEPDKNSIMMFFHRKYSAEPAAITLKGGLSENDKAWLTLMYPGKVNAVEDNGVLRSLNVLGAPVAVSSRILLSSTVSEIRYHYHKYHSETFGQDPLTSLAVKDILKSDSEEFTALPSKPHVLKGKVTGITPLIDHNSEDDLYDTVAAAVLDPQFSQVLANVVGQDEANTSGVQHDIFSPGIGMFRHPWMPPGIVSSGINPQASPDVQNFIGPLIAALGGMLGPLIFSGLPTGAAAGVYPQALPPNIEQGIWNVFGKILKHPIFINTVKDVASEMLGAHGNKKAAEEEDEE